MNQYMYKDILKERLPNCMQDVSFAVEEIVFQHDPDPKHTAKSVTNQLTTQAFPIFDWPARSPNLNAIENLWGILKKKFQTHTNLLLAQYWNYMLVFQNSGIKCHLISAQDCLKLCQGVLELLSKQMAYGRNIKEEHERHDYIGRSEIDFDIYTSAQKSRRHLLLLHSVFIADSGIFKSRNC